MSPGRSECTPRNAGFASLMALPTLRADEFANWGEESPQDVIKCAPRTEEPSEAPLSDAEYRFLQAIIAEPLKASSEYAKPARVSSKTIGPMRRRLVTVGFLRERALNTGTRGRPPTLLEVRPEGVVACEAYQQQGKGT